MVTINTILKEVKRMPIDRLQELHEFMRKIINEAEEKEQQEFEELLFRIDKEMSEEFGDASKSAEIS